MSSQVGVKTVVDMPHADCLDLLVQQGFRGRCPQRQGVGNQLS